MGLRRCSSGGRGGGLASAFVRFPGRKGGLLRSRIMSDELRSALALSRAREQIHKTHLKEVQGENKRLKEQLKEEKILYQQTLKKLHGLQQAGTRKRSPKSSRRASTGGGRMFGKGLGSPGTPWRTCLKTLARRRSVSPICCSHDATWRKKSSTSRWATSLGRSSRNKPPPWRARKG